MTEEPSPRNHENLTQRRRVTEAAEKKSSNSLCSLRSPRLCVKNKTHFQGRRQGAKLRNNFYSLRFCAFPLDIPDDFLRTGFQLFIFGMQDHLFRKFARLSLISGFLMERGELQHRFIILGLKAKELS
jgi:hypothetical protein